MINKLLYCKTYFTATGRCPSLRWRSHHYAPAPGTRGQGLGVLGSDGPKSMTLLTHGWLQAASARHCGTAAAEQAPPIDGAARNIRETEACSRQSSTCIVSRLRRASGRRWHHRCACGRQLVRRATRHDTQVGAGNHQIEALGSHLARIGSIAAEDTCVLSGRMRSRTHALNRCDGRAHAAHGRPGRGVGEGAAAAQLS